MTHNYHQQIENIIKSNKLYWLESELENTTDNERIVLLNKLLKHEQSLKTNYQINDEILQEHLKLLKKAQYQKKWQFMDNDVRLNRLDDYILRHDIKDKKIVSELKKYINDGTLKTKHIKYDNINGLINDISILKMDENNKYHLDKINENDVKKTEANDNNKIEINIKTDTKTKTKTKTLMKK